MEFFNNTLLTTLTRRSTGSQWKTGRCYYLEGLRSTSMSTDLSPDVKGRRERSRRCTDSSLVSLRLSSYTWKILYGNFSPTYEKRRMKERRSSSSLYRPRPHQWYLVFHWNLHLPSVHLVILFYSILSSLDPNLWHYTYDRDLSNGDLDFICGSNGFSDNRTQMMVRIGST